MEENSVDFTSQTNGEWIVDFKADSKKPKGLMQLTVDIQDKWVIAKVPKKYCTKIEDIKKGDMCIKVKDENYKYAVDNKKVANAGFECVLYANSPEMANCLITVIPNEINDSFGVLIVEKDYGFEKVYDWMRSE